MVLRLTHRLGVTLDVYIQTLGCILATLGLLLILYNSHFFALSSQLSTEDNKLKASPLKLQ